jgi:hypothetical protein
MIQYSSVTHEVRRTMSLSSCSDHYATVEKDMSGTRARLTRRRALLLLLAVAVLLASGVAVAVFLPRVTEHPIDGGGRVEIAVPWTAGTPTVGTLPAVTSEDLPLATLPLTRPVRIEAGAFLGLANLTFSYEGLELPAGVDPVEDVVVLTFVPELRVWMPVDTTVDPRARTATVATPHFSEWVLGVTDPEVLRDQQALAERLKWSSGGTLARIVYGEQSALGCDANRPLLPVTIRDPVTLAPKVCQELRAEGGYRLDYVNTSGMPRILTLPPGFVRHDAFVRSTNQVFADALATRHPGTAVVMDGEAITLTFSDADVTPDTRITGETDWGIYLLSIVRLMGATLLMDEKNQDAASEALDGVLLGGKLWDCLDKGTDEMRDPGGDLVKAGLKVIENCAKEAVDAIIAVTEKLSHGVIDSATFLSRRFLALLDVPELLELARTEMNGLLETSGRVFGVDTSLTIDPARTMSFDEARALALTPMWTAYSRAPDCGVLPPEFVVPGMPSDVCASTVEADLDGNRAPDRLILWRPPQEDLADDSDLLARVGAVAFLDDGTFHLLEDMPSVWPESDYGLADHFEAARVIRLGDNERQQVLVTVTVGANTVHHVVLVLGRDRRLRTVGHEAIAGPFRFFEGGGAAYHSEFGCVTSQGDPLVSFVSSVTLEGLGEDTTQYGWSRTFERLDDTVLRHVGREGGVAMNFKGPPAGGDCAAIAPTERGPEIGVPGRAANSPTQAAQEFLTAVLDDDRSGVSRLLSGTGVERSWAGGPGSDAWVETRRATQADRQAWRSATLRCGDQEIGADGESYQNCVYEVASTDIGLFLRLRGTAEGWTVAGALGAQIPWSN